MPGQTWTKAEELEAVRLRQEEGLSVEAIRMRLSRRRSHNTIRNRLQALGKFRIADAVRLKGEKPIGGGSTFDARPVVYDPREIAAAQASLREEIAAAKREAPLLRARGLLYRGAW